MFKLTNEGKNGFSFAENSLKLIIKNMGISRQNSDRIGSTDLRETNA
jgi:hypothetical protein